jgi:hypothetical protein
LDTPCIDVYVYSERTHVLIYYDEFYKLEERSLGRRAKHIEIKVTEMT